MISDITEEAMMSDRSEGKLERLAGAIVDASGDNFAYTSEFTAWLEAEASATASAAERQKSDRASIAAAERLARRIAGMRVGESMPTYVLQDREAAVIGSIRDVASEAASRRCAPWAESLSVAAGIGRELWDEPCERWVELPAGVDAATGLVAVGVSGDSMTPYLADGDVILVDTRARAARDKVIVAHRPEGHVVKHVTRLSRTTLELSSFNETYEPFVLLREPGSVVGVVVARLTRRE